MIRCIHVHTLIHVGMNSIEMHLANIQCMRLTASVRSIERAQTLNVGPSSTLVLSVLKVL